ncbi:hypothetical protein G7K_1975-t1 [Saitoella complicata NRRL Y-17804]|uniref:Uncharacterized protein n=1 Tax=Saitoella complicata (strain BCRC 22490 / CBS 7301 / JCM 7358 / NBRC 10748 / NRRL Y-17804) TaxID=698492 RepID=A0A0E9ND46_SAICN|nr:hypothetical protein G7K_1975-t1 [Saitoella complicata NRRL Y-17804]
MLRSKASPGVMVPSSVAPHPLDVTALVCRCLPASSTAALSSLETLVISVPDPAATQTLAFIQQPNKVPTCLTVWLNPLFSLLLFSTATTTTNNNKNKQQWVPSFHALLASAAQLALSSWLSLTVSPRSLPPSSTVSPPSLTSSSPASPVVAQAAVAEGERLYKPAPDQDQVKVRGGTRCVMMSGMSVR